MQTNCFFREMRKIILRLPLSSFDKKVGRTWRKVMWKNDCSTINVSETKMRFCAGISETAGVQQGGDGRFAFYFPFRDKSSVFGYKFNYKWQESFVRNVLEDSFLTNTIPEFDPSPPQVIDNAFERGRRHNLHDGNYKDGCVVVKYHDENVKDGFKSTMDTDDVWVKYY